MSVNGLLLVDKPKGWTSFDVVAKVRGILRSQQSLVTSLQSVAQETNDKRQSTPSRKVKVGHTGTLDPLATGLLVLAVGNYTKKVPELTKKDKTYEAVITLGATSNTDDAEGETIQVSDKKPNIQELKAALSSFIGEIQQIPPQFSAIKVSGVRSYTAARKGQEVKLEPRNVTIYSITDIKYDYPAVTCTVSVGSGTYIRSLARDLGLALGTGAYLSDLRRTSVGDYKISDSYSITDIENQDLSKLLLQ